MSFPRLATSAAVAALSSCASIPTSPPTEVRVAACQIEVAPSPDVNFARIDRALAEAAARGAQVACLPEACLFGWTNGAAREGAQPIPGAFTDRLGALAREHGLMIACGLTERSGEDLFNAAVLIDRDGALLLVHRKCNVLEELMDPPYARGSFRAPSIVETRLGRIGLLICADTFEDEIVAPLAAARPDLVLVPFGWAAPEDAWPEHGESLAKWVAHTARRCSAPVVGVDSVGTIHDGPWKGFVLGGQSPVCDASGEQRAVLADRTPEVIVVTLPLSVAQKPNCKQ